MGTGERIDRKGNAQGAHFILRAVVATSLLVVIAQRFLRCALAA